MPRLYIFADEAGDFTFSRHVRASRYFVVCTVTLERCDIGHDLMQLRRDLCWRDRPLGDYFHASEDKQAVRDEVFDLIRGSDGINVQATIMEKCKAQPQVKTSEARFYKYGWLYLLRHGISGKLARYDEVLITAASIGTRNRRKAFKSAVNDVTQQTVTKTWRTAFFPASTDPCLQIADYCTWAIQRKWERDDSRSFNLIRRKVDYEYDLFERGSTRYY
jgi:hypothetical protein